MMQEFSELFGRSLWLMEPTAMRALLARAASATPESVQAAMKAYSDSPAAPAVTLVGDVAVIPMNGPIVYRASWMSMYFGLASIESMRAQFRAALNDPAVRQIVWRVNSPGGNVEMVPEFADEIFASNQKNGGSKRVTAVADTMMASCAFWLGAQCDEIVVTRSSMLGAIGTYVEHQDISEMLAKAGIKVTIIKHGDHKAEGNPYEPLSDEARAEIQAYADEIGEEFETSVGRGRGVTKKVVVDTYGQGRIIRGKKSVTLGLADKMGTFDAVLGKMSKPRGLRGSADAPVLEDAPVVHGETEPPAAEGKKKTAAADEATDGVEPDAEGACPDGYSKGDDGLCYLDAADDQEAKAKATAAQQLQAQADADLTATTLALTETSR